MNIVNELKLESAKFLELSIIDLSWFESLPQHQAIVLRLLQLPVSRPSVARFFAQQFNLQPLDLSLKPYAGTILRLIVQGPSTLQILIHHIGMLSLSSLVKRSISGKFKREFWSAVQDQGATFISQKSVFYSPSLLVLFTKKVPLSFVDSSDVLQTIFLLGLRVLQALCIACGPGFSERLFFMYHCQWGALVDNVSMPDLSDKELQMLAGVVQKLSIDLGVLPNV